MLVLEENPTDKDTLNSIFRAFHTFKGGSGLLNLMPMNRTAHELENLLDLARQNKLQITSDIINVILEGGDVLKPETPPVNHRQPRPILPPGEVNGAEAHHLVVVVEVIVSDRPRCSASIGEKSSTCPTVAGPRCDQNE